MPPASSSPRSTSPRTGSVTFPQIDPADWTETARDEHPGFAWVTYERRR